MLFRTAALIALSLSAAAGQTIVQGQSPLVPLPFAGTVDVPRFDPATGRLDSVSFFASAQLRGTVGFENLDAQPIPAEPTTQPGAACVGAQVDAAFAWQHDSGSTTAAFRPALAAFDGTTDHAGTSGASIAFGPIYGGGATMPTDSQAFVLDFFNGPGTLAMPVSVLEAQGWAPDPTLDLTAAVLCEVRVVVVYNWTAHPSTFCTPSVGDNPCPCGGELGPGCPSSANPSGAALQSAGLANVGADTFTLTASGMPPSTIALFFQGTAQRFDGVGLGDGLRCVTGSCVRLGVKQASQGVASYPGPGDVPVSVKGSAPAGAFRAYQCWYRDPFPFCTAATSNLTSAVAVAWNP